MLRLRFFNVGDGDCILIEEVTGSRYFRILIDTGREASTDGPPAATCLEHLARAQIRALDKVIITHLHVDHFGGLRALMGNVSIGEIITGYFPLRPGAQMAAMPTAEKTVRNMILHLNRWSEDVALLPEGCLRTELYDSRWRVPLTANLTADLIVPSVGVLRLQRQVWNRLFSGLSAPHRRMFRASKLRNDNCLRVRLTYAGRTIELAGDCYGYVWENDVQGPCDILKVPHHGDIKAVTPLLVEKLRPRHAVVSCGSAYQPLKDRPSTYTADLLRGVGASVWYTGACNVPGVTTRKWPSVDFVIHEDGEILPPVTEDN